MYPLLDHEERMGVHLPDLLPPRRPGGLNTINGLPGRKSSGEPASLSEMPLPEIHRKLTQKPSFSACDGVCFMVYCKNATTICPEAARLGAVFLTEGDQDGLKQQKRRKQRRKQEEQPESAQRPLPDRLGPGADPGVQLHSGHDQRRQELRDHLQPDDEPGAGGPDQEDRAEGRRAVCHPGGGLYLYPGVVQQEPAAPDLYPEREEPHHPVHHLPDGHPAASPAG